MTDFAKKRVEKAVSAFIEARRPPAHIRDKVDLSYRFDGRSVEIFEIRPNWNDPSQYHEQAVAKARYVISRNEWRVYWQRADLKWHRYDPVPEVDDIDDFLQLVAEDEYACFFG